MKTKFRSTELPIAASMILMAGKVRPRRDGRHPYEQYYFYWTAYHQVYAAIARRAGRRNQLETNPDGSIATVPNGSVNIPKVILVSEKEQLYLSVAEFDEELKTALLDHPSTKFFADRIPAWQGKMIEHDAFGQRVNGVINVDQTCDSRYPVWSPIDPQVYQAYLEGTRDEKKRDFLVRQVVDLLYTVKENILHSGTIFDDAADLSVIGHALPLLELIVRSFMPGQS